MVEHRCEHAVFGGKREARNEVRYVLQAIRQLNRSHWETTSTYVLFQEGIIHETDNPIDFLLRILRAKLRASFRITARSIILDTFDFVPRYFFTTWSLPCRKFGSKEFALYIKDS